MIQTPWEHIQKKLRNPDGSEDESVKKWLEEDAENEKILDDINVIYSIAGNIPDRIATKKDQAWKNISNRISPVRQKIGLAKVLLQVAASILLIALGIGGGLYFQNGNRDNAMTKVVSPFGHKTMVLLPDGSEVWLNGNSSLTYPSDFTSSRSIELIGEAMFKVARNPQKMFTVSSDDLRVEVYGTIFNVKTYPGDGFSEVALVEGSIGLYHEKQLLKNMVAGEVITYDVSENKFSVSEGGIDQITSWKADELIIENQSFENMAKYLERWYGVEITLDESLKIDAKLSFKVKTESLTELLSIIDRITPITYEIDGKQVRISKTKN